MWPLSRISVSVMPCPVIFRVSPFQLILLRSARRSWWSETWWLVQKAGRRSEGKKILYYVLLNINASWDIRFLFIKIVANWHVVSRDLWIDVSFTPYFILLGALRGGRYIYVRPCLPYFLSIRDSFMFSPFSFVIFLLSVWYSGGCFGYWDSDGIVCFNVRWELFVNSLLFWDFKPF